MENLDFEHESQKDLLYLLEQQMQLEQEFWTEMNKKPAKIEIINKSKTVHNESQESNILPF
jgi:hypothetical protein